MTVPSRRWGGWVDLDVLRAALSAVKQAALEYADGDVSLRSRIVELLDQDRQRPERMRVVGARAKA